jgi:hypothetical protein
MTYLFYGQTKIIVSYVNVDSDIGIEVTTDFSMMEQVKWNAYYEPNVKLARSFSLCVVQLLSSQ